MLLDAVAQDIRFAHINAWRSLIVSIGEHVDAWLRQFITRQCAIQLRATCDHSPTSPVGLLDNPQAIRHTVRQEDSNGGGAGALMIHAVSSGSTRRMRPVRSCCIMPCLIALVLSRRAS